MTPQDLADVGAEIVHDPALQPERDSAGRILETHCNEGAERVAHVAGCFELDGKMADQQYEVMEANESGKWLKVDGETASLHAQGHPEGQLGMCPDGCAGGLAFAALPSYRLGELHGHIAAVAPEPMEMSGSLGHDVPMVFNVGKTNADEKESAAFPVARGEADYFVWLG